MSRALLPRHLPLGEGQLRQELSLHVLRRLLCPGTSCRHVPEGRRLPLHGHGGRIQGGDYLLQAGEQRPAPGRLPGLHLGAVAPACCGHAMASLTAANTNANPSSLLALNNRKDKEPLLGGLVLRALKYSVVSLVSVFRGRNQKNQLIPFDVFFHDAAYLQLSQSDQIWKHL